MKSACVFAVLALCGTAVADDIVYDTMLPFSPFGGWWIIVDQNAALESDSRVESPLGFENAAQVGQAIRLGGTSRHLTGLTYRMIRHARQSGDITGQALINIHRNDSGVPGELLTTVAHPFVIPSTANVFERQWFDFTAPLDVQVPSTFFWSLALTDVSYPGPLNAEFGILDVYNSLTEPYTGAFLTPSLMQDSTSLEWIDHTLGQFQGLQVRITAIPAPATGLALVAGLIATRRRR